MRGKRLLTANQNLKPNMADVEAFLGFSFSPLFGQLVEMTTLWTLKMMSKNFIISAIFRSKFLVQSVTEIILPAINRLRDEDPTAEHISPAYKRMMEEIRLVIRSWLYWYHCMWSIYPYVNFMNTWFLSSILFHVKASGPLAWAEVCQQCQTRAPSCNLEFGR